MAIPCNAQVTINIPSLETLNVPIQSRRSILTMVEMVLPEEEEIGQSCLDEQDDGDAEGELAVLGFVAEEVHAQQGADAAAGDG